MWEWAKITYAKFPYKKLQYWKEYELEKYILLLEIINILYSSINYKTHKLSQSIYLKSYLFACSVHVI